MRLPPPSPPWYLRPLHALQQRRYGTVLQPTALWTYRPGALQYAEAMTCTPLDVDEAEFRRMRAAFAPEAIVELTAVVAFQNMSARFNAALQADAHGFCKLPPAARAANNT